MGSGSSKVAFRDVLQELGEKEISVKDDAFWSKLWKTESSPHDVFEVISPAAVRKLKAERPGNVEALLRMAVAHLEKVLANPDPFLLQSGMTAVSVLTRVLPFLLESYANSETGEVDSLLERMFWSTEALPSSEAEGRDDKGAEDSSFAEASTPPVALGSALVSVAMRLLFTRQLTVDVFSSCHTSPAGHEDNPLEVHDPSALWSAALGAGRKASIHRGRDLEANRIDVMRLVLVLMCEPLYQRNVDFDPTASRFAAEVCSLDAPFASELFFSLLAVVSTYDPVGWGVPYGGSFTSDLPQRQLGMAAQLLVVLLDYGKPPLPVVTSPTGPEDESEHGHRPVREDPPSPGEKGYNVFRNLVLHGLKEEEDFRLVFFGLSRLLNNLHLSQNSYMPGTTMAVNCYQEVLVLLWKIMEENPVFTQYVLKHCDINEIIVPVCYLLVENRKDVSKGGLIHICTFLLLKLSGERLFGVAINKPCSVRLPTDLPLFSGSHLDLLVLTVHKLLVAGTERLSTLYHCFLTVLCNVSPYAKSLSLVSSIKLVNLFELFTSPRNLYSSETNQTYVSLLLEMFSNIIQYQYTGNARLVYAIVRRQEAFESLYELDLPAAVAAASKFARSGAAAGQKARAAAAAAAAQVELAGAGAGNGVGAGGGAPAIGLKAGPEDRGGRVSASHAVLQQSSGVARAGTGAVGLAETEATGEPGAWVGEQETSVPLRFRPTQEWLDNVRSEVPFNTIIRLLRNLAPQVEEMCQAANALDENTMVEFVTNTTMVGLLPVPHPIVIRKYHPNQHTAIWFTAFMWGVIFVHNQELPMFDGNNIRLFTVTTGA
eukprot:jgi/Undpi1/6335/HiC_scaffold_20.g08818.m1